MTNTRRSTRRDFLREAGGGAVLAGLFTSLPADLARAMLAGARAQPAHEQIRIGCIGVGNQGKANLGKVLEHVVAVCDVDKTRLREARARVEKANRKKCDSYGDYRKLLERTDVHAVYKYANGVTLICGQGQKGGTTFEGDKGTIHVDRGKLESRPADLVKRKLTEEDVHLSRSNNHHGNWLECIKTRKLPICDVAIGHRSATVCHLGNMAIRLRRKVHWDPVREEVVGDREAAAMLSRPYRAPWKFPDL